MVPGISFIVSKLGFRGIAIGLLTLTIGGTLLLGYRHYTGLLDTVSTLRTNNAQLQDAYETQKQTIGQMDEAITDWQQAQNSLKARVEELSVVAQEAKTEARQLDALFAEHDLGRLAREKPGLIERRVNRGTRDSLSLLECATAESGCGTEADRAP